MLFVLFVAIAPECNKDFSALVRFLRSQKMKKNAIIEITTTGTATATPVTAGLTPFAGQALAEEVTVTVEAGAVDEEFELDVSTASPVIFVKVTFAGVRVKLPFVQSAVSGLQVCSFAPGTIVS